MGRNISRGRIGKSAASALCLLFVSGPCGSDASDLNHVQMLQSPSDAPQSDNLLCDGDVDISHRVDWSMIKSKMWRFESFNTKASVLQLQEVFNKLFPKKRVARAENMTGCWQVGQASTSCGEYQLGDGNFVAMDNAIYDPWGVYECRLGQITLDFAKALCLNFAGDWEHVAVVMFTDFLQLMPWRDVIDSGWGFLFQVIADALSFSPRLDGIEEANDFYGSFEREFCGKYDKFGFMLSDVFGDYQDGTWSIKSGQMEAILGLETIRADEKVTILSEVIEVLLSDQDQLADIGKCPHVLIDILVAKLFLMPNSSGFEEPLSKWTHALHVALHDVLTPHISNSFYLMINLRLLRQTFYRLAKAARTRTFNPRHFSRMFIHAAIPYSELHPYEPAIERAFGPINLENDYRVSSKGVCIIWPPAVGWRDEIISILTMRGVVLREALVEVPEPFMLPLIEKIYERDSDGAPVNRYHLPKKIENFHGDRSILAIGVQSVNLAGDKKTVRAAIKNILGDAYRFDNVIHCTDEADWVEEKNPRTFWDLEI